MPGKHNPDTSLLQAWIPDDLMKKLTHLASKAKMHRARLVCLVLTNYVEREINKKGGKA